MKVCNNVQSIFTYQSGLFETYPITKTGDHASKKRNCEKDETAKIAQFNVFFCCYVYGDVYKSSLSGFWLGVEFVAVPSLDVVF